jgi:hypothetical protein
MGTPLCGVYLYTIYEYYIQGGGLVNYFLADKGFES